MQYEAMINEMLKKCKKEVEGICAMRKEKEKLDPEFATKMELKFVEIAMEIAREGYTNFLKTYDKEEDTLEIKGDIYRNKLKGKKKS